MYTQVIGPLLRALSKNDAERAHEIMLRLAQMVQSDEWLKKLLAWHCESSAHHKHTEVWGIPFKNPVGIAAGLDKNAEILPALQACGPGFIEFGTVLPRPQTGNERPRIFRLVAEQAVINRLGFNSKGVLDVVENLESAKAQIHIPLFASLGMMKTTPLEDALKDYTRTLHELWRFAQVFVANISSPNTPGLRELQGGRYIESFVRQLVEAAQQTAAVFETPTKPVLIKIAPDITLAQLDEIIEACEQGGASGIVIGNTTLLRPLADLTTNDAKTFAKEAGGLSGHPIFERMKTLVTDTRKRTRLPIVTAGGIDSTERAKVIFDLDVQLIQVHTPLYFKGPRLIRDLKKAAHK